MFLPRLDFEELFVYRSEVNSFLRQCIEPATRQPRIDSVSPAHGFLLFILCLISVEFGMLVGEGAPGHHGALLNLAVAGGLLLHCLSFQFRWSQLVTIILRALAASWVCGVFALLFFWR